ncbi:MAG TPA: cytochrome c oxidase subunit 3 [Dongiaceae bacterium]
MTEQIELHEPFVEAEQQRQSDLLGMFVFLGTEVMLFGGLFAVAFALRIQHAHEYAESSRHLHVWIGAINTAILLTSSLLVALAVSEAHRAMHRRAALLLAGAAALGIAFLGMKAVEYGKEYAEGVLPAVGSLHFADRFEHLFMNLYFISTALHALHVTVGILLLAVIGVRLWRGGLPLPGRVMPVELTGLYWHLVDVIWIFLYPVLYLAR